jgi:hypothetical protein
VRALMSRIRLKPLTLSLFTLVLAGLTLDLRVQLRAVSVAAQNKATSIGVQSEIVPYKIARKFQPSKKNDPMFVVISVGSAYYSSDKMTRLARQLNRDFSEEPELFVEIMDDERTAENVPRAGDYYPLYMKAKRGEYHLDREKGLEYVQFSEKRGRPWNEVTLNFGRARPRLKDRRKARRLVNGRAFGDDHRIASGFAHG